MDICLFNETPRVLNVDKWCVFPADCLELTTKQWEEIKKTYPGVVRWVDDGYLTVYDCKKDKDTIQARLTNFQKYMDMEPRQVPIIKKFGCEPYTREEIAIMGARAKKRYLGNASL